MFSQLCDSSPFRDRAHFNQSARLRDVLSKVPARKPRRGAILSGAVTMGSIYDIIMGVSVLIVIGAIVFLAWSVSR